MSIKILSKELIKPSKPTPPHLSNYEPSFLDQIAVQAFFPLVLFYKVDAINNMSINRLKETLAEVLNSYYPLAARVSDPSDGMLDCNDEGVLFIEARASLNLSQHLARPIFARHDMLFPTAPLCLEQVKSHDPLLCLQVTIFECYSIAIAFNACHKVMDAATVLSFLKSWAKLNQGLQNEIIIPDFTSSRVLFPRKHPLPGEIDSLFHGLFWKNDEDESIVERFVLDSRAITKLKMKFACADVPRLTRVEVSTVFILQHLMLATKQVKGTLRSSIVTHAVNLRPRFKSPRNTAFGNMIWLASSIYDPPESKEIEPFELVEKVREMFSHLTTESLEELENDGAFEYVYNVAKDDKDLFQKMDRYKFTSWCGFGIYDIDFGCGKPIWAAPLTDPILEAPTKHGILFLESPQSGGFEVWMCQGKQLMTMLKKDLEFLEYVSINPRIS